MLKVAFKEWAAICTALAEGRQSLILRKGGIAEEDGTFRPEHARFWLFPTYTHQQRAGLETEATPYLDRSEAERPADGRIRLSHFAEVLGVYRAHNLPAALAVGGLHLWSPETVRNRFLYRTPGLYILPVRIYQAAQVTEIRNTPAYDGCRSWVDLDEALPTAGATPVLADHEIGDLLRTLDGLLNPSALA